jgi:arsenite methyltransferase
MKSAKEIKEAVKQKYGSIARQKSSCCGETSSCCNSGTTRLTTGYDGLEMEALPEEADLGLGCGFPTRSAGFQEGQTVVDLGSGAGVDCFLAAKAVGPTGKVIGIDMTTEMIEKARTNAKSKNYANVEFRLGELESLPVEDDSVDVVISNCVLNLVPDKEKAFAEIFRILKPNGYFVISDVVYVGEMPKQIQEKLELWTGCLAGALPEDKYLQMMRKVGFQSLQILSETKYDQYATDSFWGKSITLKGMKIDNSNSFGDYEG